MAAPSATTIPHFAKILILRMLRCFRPRRLLYIYIAGTLTLFTWFIYNLESFCPDSKTSEGHYDNGYIDIRKKAQDLSVLEKKLSFLEKNLRRKFPSEVDGILDLLSSPMPTIYAITPTYARSVQKAELTRLLNIFIQVPNFHWIVVEDSHTKTSLVTAFLQKSGMKYTHLNEPTPEDDKIQPKDPHWFKPRGVRQRNKALEWLRKRLDPNKDQGVVYFADDDNTYSIELFQEMRNTTRLSVWPVGLVGYLRYERPVVKNKQVVGWFTAWKPERRFAMDMAGFAVNLRLFFQHPEAVFSGLEKRGELESDLVSKLGVTMADLEPKADHCTKVYVWHTRTETPSLKNEDKLAAAGKHRSDPRIEV